MPSALLPLLQKPYEDFIMGKKIMQLETTHVRVCVCVVP